MIHALQKLGIKDAKGMEFDDVVLIDFFSGLPGKVQDWWKKRFQNSAISPVAETQVIRAIKAHETPFVYSHCDTCGMIQEHYTMLDIFMHSTL